MSKLSQFHAQALARAMSHAGDTFACAGSEFTGVLSPIERDDPRAEMLPEAKQVIRAATSDVPAAAQVRGAWLTGSDGLRYSVARCDEQPGGYTEILVAPFPAA